MRKIVVVLVMWNALSLTGGAEAFAQTQQPELKFDSLVHANEHYQKQDEVKLKMLNQLTFGYPKVNPSQGIETGQKAVALAQKLNNQLLLAEAFNNKALNYLAKSDYTQSLEYFEKALSINQSLKNTYGIAHNTCNIGDVIRKKGDYKKARTYFDEALTLFESINSKNGIAKVYIGLGNTYYGLSDYPHALQYFEKALSIHEQLGDKFGMAGNLGNIGSIYSIQSDYQRALKYFQKALTINEQLGNKSGIAKNFNNIGNIYAYTSNNIRAVEYYQKALSIDEQLGDKSGIAYTCTNIGNIYYNQSDYSHALDFHKKALNINEQLGDKRGMAMNFGAIGNCYTFQSDYPHALEYQQKALNINEYLENKSGIAYNFNNIGNIYFSESDYPRALKYYQKALKIFEELGIKNGLASNLGNIGNIYYQESNYPRALENYQKALSILEQLGDKRGMSYSLGNIGSIYTKQSDFIRAFDSHQKALNIDEQLGYKGGIAYNFATIGNLYRDAPDSLLVKIGIKPEQRFEKALEYQNKSLQLASEIGEVSQQKVAWQNLSNTYEKQGDYSKAYHAYKKYIALRDSTEGEEVKRQITRKEMQFEYAKTEDSLRFQQQLTTEQLERQRLQNIQQAQELILRNRELQLSNKEKDLHRLAYLKEKAEKQQKENLLNLSEKEKQLQEEALQRLGKEKDLQQTELQLSQAEVKSKNQQRNAFIIGMFLFLTLSFFVYRNYVGQRKSNRIIEASNRELKETQSQLVQQEKLASLGALTAGIAHEIKNPLNFVNNFAELSNELIDEYAEAKTQEEKDELLQIIKQNLFKINEHGKRADSIVKSMLEHSRSGTGEKQLTDINKLCEEFLNLAYHGMRANIKDFNCKIEKQLDANLTLVKIVQQDISRVILNLINNAFYAMKDTPAATLTISTKALPKAVLISIRDNGNGIPEHIKQKIFEPFFTTKPSGQGTGLGLSLSFDIIKAHGGKIEVNSEKDQGTEFVITLPIA